MSKKEHTHYREDLKDVEELLKTATQIVKTTIESGKCTTCKKRQFAMEIPKQDVIIGENVRIMLVHMIIVQGLSYSQAKESLEHKYGITLSTGEITNILKGESILLTPVYNTLVQELSEESKAFGAHYDETTWKTESRGKEVSQGNYSWIKIGIQSNKQLIWFGCSRGKGVAEKLRGEREESKGVSDDYGSYRDLFDAHQLCWAHPHRKFREIAESKTLSKKKQKICQKIFKSFSSLYKKSRRAKENILAGKWTEEKKKEERKKRNDLFSQFCISKKEEPDKIKTIKQSLSERQERDFIFFDYPSLPLDNNKAERGIRKIVIKRKKSLSSSIWHLMYSASSWSF